MYQHPGQRPVYLSLSHFRFPLNAWLSIGHRVTGLGLFIALLGYLALTNLIVWHDLVSYQSVQGHWITNSLHSAFWISLAFHWLTGLRHLLAEHFTRPTLYQFINSKPASLTLLTLWLLLSFVVVMQVWWR